MQPLVSVIVPIYNTEEYLTRCLDSLCRQSLKNIEILLIDDDSPDQSNEICNQCTAKDSRFKVIHNLENKGLSEVRNTGIRQATADYLMFVDSDDWVHEDFCKAAYECAINYQADLVMFRCQRIKDTNNFQKSVNAEKICYTDTSWQSGYKTRLEAMDLLQEKNVGPAPWNKLYHKKLFKDIFYPPNFLYEGTGTTYKIVWQASRVYYLDKALYYYCYRAGSITTLKTKKALNDWITMALQQYHDLTAWGYSPDKLNVFLKKTALGYCIKKIPDDSDEYYTFCAKVLRESNNIPFSFTWKQKILLVLFKYCRPLFELLCNLSHKKIC